MNKKLLSCLCAGAMALSMAVPAFAADISNGASVNFQGKPADGEIAVVMQTGGTNLYVNPYGLPYALGYGEVYATAGATTFDKTKDLAIQEPSTATEGFFSDTAVIQNNSDIDLDVKVSMTTTEKGDAKVVLAADVPAANSREHQYMHGNLEIATAELTTGTAKVTTTAAVTGANPAPAVKTDVDGVQVVVPDWDSKATVAIPAGSGTAGTAGAASAAADTGIMLAAAETTTDSFGTSTTVPGFVAYRLAGTAAPADSDGSGGAGAAWAEADVADVTVAFTFTPHVPTPPGP